MGVFSIIACIAIYCFVLWYDLYKTVSVIVNGHDDHDTIVLGKGNISFKSCYEEDLI